MQRAMGALQGRERASQLIAGIKHEERVRQDPLLKAGRLVQASARLEAEHGRLGGWDQAEARGKVETRMRAIAEVVRRDPQLETIMRARAKDLGIGPASWLGRVLQAPSIERAINQSVGRGFGQERGPGMSR
jgi:hypothetical protein